MPFASRSARSYIRRNSRSAEALRSCLSWGSSRPSTVPPVPRPLPVRPPATEVTGERSFGPTMPLVDSRSALVVLHHRDGFLRDSGCELVASRCRSWGSSRFPTSRARLPHPLVLRRERWEVARNTIAVLAMLTPFEESPSPSAVPRHRGHCLLAVFHSSPACIQRSFDRSSGARALEERGCRRDPARVLRRGVTVARAR